MPADCPPTCGDGGIVTPDKPNVLIVTSLAAHCLPHPPGGAPPRTVAFGNWVAGLNFSTRTERWKLIRNHVPIDATSRRRPEHELYDLAADPMEVTDLAEDPAFARVLAGMRARLNGWLRDMNVPTAREVVPVAERLRMLADYRRRYEAVQAKPR
jgi:hypothetical protein